MANFVQISGFSAYPARKYSTRTITQIDPFLYLGHYVKFSYDFNYYQELIRILEEGGSFEQTEKNNEKPTVYTFNKETLQLTVNSPINRRLSLTYKLNQPVVDEIIELIKDDVKNTMADDKLREALKAAAAKERLIKFRNKPEIAPESPKKEKQEEIKQEEKTIAMTQKNDNNRYKKVYSLDEVIETILKKENLTKEDLLTNTKINTKMNVWDLCWPSQTKYFEARYKISVPEDSLTDIRKVFIKEGESYA